MRINSILTGWQDEHTHAHTHTHTHTDAGINTLVYLHTDTISMRCSRPVQLIDAAWVLDIFQFARPTTDLESIVHWDVTIVQVLYGLSLALNARSWYSYDFVDLVPTIYIYIYIYVYFSRFESDAVYVQRKVHKQNKPLLKIRCTRQYVRTNVCN